MLDNASYSDIKKYVTDDELEFDWEYPFQGGIEMKVRINKGVWKTEAKVGIEISALAGYGMDVFSDKSCIKDTEKVTVCMEGAVEKACFIQAVLRLALFLKLNGYKIWEE